MTKVFVSHKKEDGEIAIKIASRLKNNNISCYLDMIDSVEITDGPELGDYIRAQMSSCTQLIAIVSPKTVNSWWVPWEIGVATEKNFPIASFLIPEISKYPSYLYKWPRLMRLEDVDSYAIESKTFVKNLSQLNLAESFNSVVAMENYNASVRNEVSAFHKALMARLEQ